ncbi:MAG: TRAP transporter small permease subunit [Treponema sp.]|jgi:TRAP-type C4-dicarboxylate transport system permease small subunit|nr:TRAP transporter small permease subunit [Treponema sp.]
MRKIYHALCKAEVAICSVGFMFLVAFVFLSAILRFFRISMSWNIDLALFLLAWTAFLGADIAWREGKLVGVDLITRRLPRKIQKIIEIALYLVTLCALVLIIVFGSRLAIIERLRTYQSIPIPFSLVTMSLVTAALSMALSTILKIRRSFLSFNANENKTAGGAA